MSTEAPILSICILTYNRADLLEVSLKGLITQVKGFQDVVEVVICDNASPDNTTEVVKQAQEHIPIRYHRNDSNIGVIRNMLKVFELASGRFVWWLGDDDSIIKDKLAFIVGILKDCHRLDFIFANCAMEWQEFRDEIVLERDCEYNPIGKLCYMTDFRSRLLPKWEDVLQIEGILPPSFFTSAPVGIIRRSVWEANVHKLNLENEEFSSIDTFYPNLVVFAHAMVGKPIYYIGEPLVVMGEGRQHWVGRGLSSWTIFLYEWLNLLDRLGVDRRIIKEGRYNILMFNRQILPTFLTSDAASILGREHFSLPRFIWNNRQFPGLLAELLFSIWWSGWPSVWLSKFKRFVLFFLRR